MVLEEDDDSSKSVSFGEINCDDESSTLLESVRARADAPCVARDDDDDEVDDDEEEVDDTDDEKDDDDEKVEEWEEEGKAEGKDADELYLMSLNDPVTFFSPSSATIGCSANILIASSGIGLWRT